MTTPSTVVHPRLRRPVRWSRWMRLGVFFLVFCAFQLALFYSYTSASALSWLSAFSYRSTVCWYRQLLSISSHECHVIKSLSRSTHIVDRTPAPPPRFIFYRILGNDMPPLQSVGQLRQNLEYVLKHESEFPDCEKRWLLNRIVNTTEKTLIRNLLGSCGFNGSRVLDIPFNVDDVANTPPNSTEVGLNPIFTSRLHQMKQSEGEIKEMGRKIRDIMGLNQGRNVALRDGLSTGARWVLLFDANQFVPNFSWTRIVKGAGEADRTKNVRHIEVPMVRLREEQIPGWLHADADVAEVVSHSEGRMEEGQLIFRNDSSEMFDENMAYSLAPKQELMDRICSFNSTSCACHDTVWWWTIKTPKAMRVRIDPCGVSIRLWSYPEPEAAGLKPGDGNARRDMRMESAHRFVTYVEGLLERRKKELQKT